MSGYGDVWSNRLAAIMVFGVITAFVILRVLT